MYLFSRPADPKAGALCSQLTPHLLAQQEILAAPQSQTLLHRAERYILMRVGMGINFDEMGYKLENAVMHAHARQEGNAIKALEFGQSVLGAHEKVFGPDHGWTKDSARVIAAALDALGRKDHAAALRQRYGLTPEAPNAS
jgi:Tetratricopeptide repeat